MNTEKKRGRWMAPLLVVSLALNLLVAGAVGAMLYTRYATGLPFGPPPGAGAMARHGGELSAMGRPGVMLLASWRMLRELPAARRKALRKLVETRRAAIRKAYEQVALARRDLGRIIAADALDAGAYRAAVEKLRNADARAREMVVDLAAAFIRALTPAERRLYVQKMQETAARRGHWRNRR